MKNSLAASIHRSTRRLLADENLATTSAVAKHSAFARPVRPDPALTISGPVESASTSSSADT